MTGFRWHQNQWWLVEGDRPIRLAHREEVEGLEEAIRGSRIAEAKGNTVWLVP